MAFQKATRAKSKLRMALIGPSGGGKTYTALSVASGLGERIAVIDTERGSASKYAGIFDFDVCELETFSPQQYITTIKEADAAGYDVLVIDSLSHAWMGKDGALEQVDKAAKRSQSGNSFAAWREVTPLHNALVDAILQCRAHVIVTMRSKTEYVIETNEKGRTYPRKVGTAPIQRDGLEYEFDVVADMDIENNFIVSKTRCPALTGAVIPKPGADLAETLRGWLSDGVDAKPAAPKPTTSAPLPRGDHSTNEQVKAIHIVAAKIWGSDDAGKTAYKSWLSSECKVESSKDLTAAQATDVIDKLNVLLKERQAA